MPLLLDLGCRAGVLQLLEDPLGFLAVDALLDRLGGLVDQVLGFLESEPGDLTDDLDDPDLGIARPRQDNRELGLLGLRRRSASAATSTRSGRRRDRGRRRDAELGLDRLDGVHHVHHRPFLQRRYEVVDTYLCHFSS